MVPRMSLEDRIRLMEGKPPRSSSDTTVVDDEEDWGDLEPFFFDEAEARADHARWALSVKLHDRMMNTLDQILEYDPKHGRVFFTRISFVDLMTFDHDKESLLGPMRHTDATIHMVDETVCREGQKQLVTESANPLSVNTTASSSAVNEKLFAPCNSANFLSVKIASSDVGFPVQVYGTIIARDSLDGRKCVYLFHCDRDHSHLILTKDEELILTGPKRGLALEDAIYFEIDLKIKGEGKCGNDKQLSKGYLMLDGVPREFEDEMEVESYALDSMLSRVVVKCAVEKRAVERALALERAAQDELPVPQAWSDVFGEAAAERARKRNKARRCRQRAQAANVKSEVCPGQEPPVVTDEDDEDLFFPCNSANILSVNIASSDVGFPINVYGTVIARDILDRKCVYLFRCDRDQSYLILNKEEQLILTGPKRGLALIDTISIETDLKIKGTGKPQEDKQLSKGFVEVKDDRYRVDKEDMLVECSIDSMLSEVVVKCAVENCAVEATIAIEVVQEKFCGEITASTTNIRGSLVLYDSKLISAEMSGKGVIPLLRCVVAVGVKEKLLVTIARAGVCKFDHECTIKFTPSINGRDTAEVTCGSVKMYVKVVWSVIKRRRLDRPSTVVNRLDRPSTVVKRR